MKKAVFSRRFAAFGISLLLCAALAGCGGARSTTETTDSIELSEEFGSYSNAASATGPYAMDGSAESTLLPETQTQNDSRKIIYNATLQMQSTTFETARTAVLAAVQDCDAYLEYSDSSGSAENGNRSVSYTVRVPVDNYSKFLASAGQAGSVQSLTENAQDITSSYIDVQARLTALQAQRNRLNELADSAETTADLLEIESQLSDVQYQLENYTQQLRAMADQVSYSTVELYLAEVRVLTPTGTTFGERAAAALSGGWHGFISFVQGVVLVAIYLWPLLVLVCLGGVALLITRPARAARRAARQAKRAAAKAPAPAPYDGKDAAAPKYEQPPAEKK